MSDLEFRNEKKEVKKEWTPEMVRDFLLDNGVSEESLSKYGKPYLDENGKEGRAKEFSDLAKELNDGETIFVVDENGEVKRQVEVMGIDVYYVSPESGKRYKLVETKQVFQDGTIRSRDLPTSLSEKMVPGEEKSLSAARALKEELNLDVENGLLNYTEEPEIVIRNSPSYPGLKSEYKRYGSSIELSDDQKGKMFEEDGSLSDSAFIEVGSKKDTHFGWKEVE